MPRFTMYRSEFSGASDATAQARSVGARVIVAKPGLALIEATEQVVQQLRIKLPEWKITEETTARIPKPRPKVPPFNKRD